MSKPDDHELFEVLKAMRACYPEWRFGQLVCNVATWARGAQTSSVWDVEDRELIQAAREHLRSREAQNDSCGAEPDAPNPAIASRFQIGRHGRGVGDPGR